ncbi:SIMPL domain-containing protein [Chitinimonas sp.]|uniref:SIMPL domain-containing protein n=1 Tax=Chitinimonas sp. TaxID=1934313 RepID=UPI002F9519D9
MKMQNSVLALAILSSLSGAVHALDVDRDVVYVTGTASLTLAPDSCVINATVASDIAQREKAAAAIKVSSKQVFDAARSLGVEVADIDGSDVTVSKRYFNEKETVALQQKYVIKVRTIKACEQLVERLSAIPKLEDLNASFQYAKQQQVAIDLTIKAAEQARTKAEMLASALGRKVGNVLSIADEPFATAQQRYGGGGLSGYEPTISAISSDKEGYQFVRAPATLSFERTIYVRFALQ